MKTVLKILILEDSESDAELIKRILLKQKQPCIFQLCMSKDEFLPALKDFMPDVILSDNSLTAFNAAEALKITRQHFPNMPFILVTGTVSEEYAALIIKEGADDYILKDRMARLPQAIVTAIQHRKAEKEISDYRYALDQSTIVAITDQKGIIIYVNENFCKISGYNPEELIGRDHNIVSSSFHSAAFIKNLWTTIAKGHIWTGELRNRAKDGSIYWVDTSIVPFLNNDGKPYQYLAIRKDITEKKNNEEQLILSEEKYRTIFLKSPLPKWIFDNETLRFLDVNEAAINHYGYTREEFLSMFLWEIRHELNKGELMADVANIKDNPDAKFGTRMQKKKNRDLITVEITAHPLEYNNQKATMVVSNDITAKIDAAKQKEFDTHNLKALINNTKDLMWSVDTELKLITFNDSFKEAVTSIQNPQLLKGQEMLAAQFTGAEPERYKMFYSRALSGESFTITDHFEAPLEGWAEISFYPIRKNTEVIGTACFLRNVTERKEAEKNLRSLEQEMQVQQIQQHKKVAKALIKGQENERNHIGKELHDNINQILAGSKMFLAVAGNKNKITKELVKYPMELIDDSMQEIRLLCQKLVTPIKNIDLEELLRALLYNFDQNTATKTRFIYDVPKEILSDELKLNIYRIIQEQINNIMKYATAKNVQLSLKIKDNVIDIGIVDDGKGFNVKTNRKGIGISNIINRAETFNGKVKIRSRVGEGCEIDIAIPC